MTNSKHQPKRRDSRWNSVRLSKRPEVIAAVSHIMTHPYVDAINVSLLFSLLYPKSVTKISLQAMRDNQIEALYQVQDVLDKISITITGDIS